MKRGFVDTPDGQIHYRMAGSGEPVIVLHPTALSSAAIAPMIEALGREVWAIGMDTMGYGDSDRPPLAYTSIGQFAQTVAWLIEGLGIERAHLAGTSTGGQIALQAAADFPQLVQSLFLQEPFNWNTEKRRALHHSLHRVTRRTEDGSYLLELWRRSTRAHDSLPDVRLHEVRFLNLLYVNEAEGAEAYGTMGWEGAAPNAMTHQDVWEVGARVQCPTYVTYIPPRDLHRELPKWLETIPRSKGLIEGASFFRQPDEAARILIDWIRYPGV